MIKVVPFIIICLCLGNMVDTITNQDKGELGQNRVLTAQTNGFFVPNETAFVVFMTIGEYFPNESTVLPDLAKPIELVDTPSRGKAFLLCPNEQTITYIIWTKQGKLIVDLEMLEKNLHVAVKDEPVFAVFFKKTGQQLLVELKDEAKE